MATDASEPELSADAPCPGCAQKRCPQCGAAADPVLERNLAALDELLELNLVMVRSLRRKVEAAGEVTEDDRAALDDVGRAMRKTVSVRDRISGESKKTPEQRHAEALRRIEAQERARFRLRRATIQKALTGEIDAHIERTGMPNERENLLADMHERLLDEHIWQATTQMEISAIILGICQDMGITPRDHIWSDALMQYEIHRTHEAVMRHEAARVPPEGASMEPPKPEPWGNGEEVKIGSVTFNPDGSFKCRDYDPPESEWPPGILNQPPIDLFKDRKKPPDTG